MRFGLLELLVIFALVLLIVGPKQIPKLMDTMSSSVKKFKSEFKEEDSEKHEESAS